jgi:hypothetical protein
MICAHFERRARIEWSEPEETVIAPVEGLIRGNRDIESSSAWAPPAPAGASWQ